MIFLIAVLSSIILLPLAMVEICQGFMVLCVLDFVMLVNLCLWFTKRISGLCPQLSTLVASMDNSETIHIPHYFRMLLKKLGIHYFCMYEIDKYGISKCVTKALEAVNPK